MFSIILSQLDKKLSLTCLGFQVVRTNFIESLEAAILYDTNASHIHYLRIV